MRFDSSRALYERHRGAIEGILAVALVLAAHVLGLAVSFALTRPFDTPIADPSFLAATGFWTAVHVGLYGVGFLGLAVAYLRYRGLAGELLSVAVPTRDEFRPLALAAGGGVLALVATDVLSYALFDYPVTKFVTLGSTGGLLTPVDVVLGVVLLAPAVEVLYRGAVQGPIGRVAGPGAGIGVGALLYALAGAWFTGGGAVALVAVALLWVQGGLNGHAYETTGNIAVPVLSAAAFFTAFNLLYLLPVPP